MSLRNKFFLFALALALLSPALTPVKAAAGGAIAGTVTDPKGAVIVGATVTVTDAAGKQAHAPVATDAQGRFRVEGLPAGTYTVVVNAPGFKQARREQVAVAEGKAAALDFSLEIAPVEAGTVEVKSGGIKPNEDPVYRQLRQQAESAQDFSGEYAAVAGLVLRRDAATFTLRSGEVYFLPPVEGRVTGAVFVGEGEFGLTPPVEYEKRSLALFTGEPSITEQFTKLTLRFTDKTYEEIKASPQARMARGGPQAARARDIYRDNQELLRRELHTNMELRTLVDLYTPERPGFLVAFIGGRRFEKLVFQIDPLGIPEVSPEEVLLASYGQTDGGFWTAFHLSDEYAKGTASSDEDHRIYDITHHEIDGAIKGAKITATDTVTLRALVPGTRVLPFTLFRTLRASRVRDSEGRDLQFVQEGKDKDADFGVIWPEPLEVDKDTGYQIEFYANQDLPNFMRGEGGASPEPGVPVAPIQERPMSRDDGSMSTTGMADSAIADAENSTRIYNAYFGKMPYTRVAMTQQPAPNFGQAWPTLVYMPYTAFMDATQRWMATNSIRAATNDFFQYVGPHEVAHQWWGHAVGWKSYRDQWMSEGFAEFSASLYVQTVRGNDKFLDFWQAQRRLITEARPATPDPKPYPVGPVTQGYRLGSGKTGSIARFMIYPKGAYILHMLRMMMFDRKTGDQRFQAMMQDFVKSNFNKDVSTEDFKRAVERHMTHEMDIEGNGRMDWFFNEWVYGMEMPSYKFEYTMNGQVLSGRITQSGVSDGFAMLVPVYLDFGKGWVRLGEATIKGNSTVELGQIKLPEAPKHVAVAALTTCLP